MSLLLYYQRERDTGRVANNVTVIILHKRERDTGSDKQCHCYYIIRGREIQAE